MSNLLDLTQFKTLKELQDYANKQFMTISVMKDKNTELQEKVKHLEGLLSSKATVLNVASEQEEICKIEIHRMYQKSLRVPLDFQEVKALESYTRILMVMQGKDIDGKKEKETKKAMKQLTPKELIDIALQKTPEDAEGN